MRITFIANGCAIYESNGFRLVSDPWLTDGAFEGSWYHYPPLQTRPHDLGRVDALYVSHIHPDHFDPQTLRHFDPDTPVVILDYPLKFLERRIRAFGFRQVIPVADKVTTHVGPFKLTLFGPLSRHQFVDATVGNIIDSGVLIRDNYYSVLNLNDNVPSLAAARELASLIYGGPTMLQVQYCAAGPYPSCFQHYSAEEMLGALNRTIQTYLGHFAALAEIFAPNYVMPFAGDFVLGGSQWRKNRVLGTVTSDEVADYMRERMPDLKVVRLNEGLTFDLSQGQIINGLYKPLDVRERDRYIEGVLSRKSYPHETEPVVMSDELASDLATARENLWKWQVLFDYTCDLNQYLDLGDQLFWFNWKTPDAMSVVPCSTDLTKPYLLCRMDLTLLRRILRSQAHWNNAEVGCHIDFWRSPDVYNPDVHTLLSFFHGARPS